MTEPVIILCAEKNYAHVPGEWKSCDVCKVEVFLSTSSLNSVIAQGLAASDISLSCFACLPKDVKLRAMALSPEQVQEIRKGFSK